MRSFSLVLGLVIGIGLLFTSPTGVDALAAQVGDTDAIDQADPRMLAAVDRSTRSKWGKKTPPPKKKPKYKPWGEVTKDADKLEGLITIYKKGEDVFFEIKEDQLNTPFVNFTNYSQGIGARFILGGLPLGILQTVMFDFNRTEDHMQIRRLNPLFRSGGDEALEEALDLAYGNSILASLPIASEKDGSLLIKMNDYLLSDFADVGQQLLFALGKPVKLDSKKKFFGSIKTFPENVEIESMLTFSPGSRRGLNLPQVPDSRYIEIGVNSSIRMLPAEPMKPRVADDRVGFFTTNHKNFSRDSNESFIVHYINHWRLEKKDSTATLSEPKKQIVYYLDSTIPEQYRPYVKRGVEMWQRAFEEAGFKNAIVTKNPDDEPEYDAEDARFNTIRWIVSDEPSFGAIGPHRTDPRTGEILESDILMEQNMIAGFSKSFRRYAGPEAFLKTDPALMFMKDPSTDAEAARFMEMQKLGFGCTLGHGFSTNFEFGTLAALISGDGMDVPEEYVGDAIAEVTAHEVGHGLGLRHNYRSSAAVPYERLNDRELIEDIGLTGSVMDYNAVNVSRDRSKQGHYWTPTVGTYDRWAVKWGYTPFDDDEEHRKLMSIAEQASEKPHKYSSDEDAFPAGALDPESMAWDLSDDVMAWADERIALCQDILTNPRLVDRVVRDGDSFAPLRNAVTNLLVQEYIAGTRTVRYVGGQYTTRVHYGDNGGTETPFKPVPPAEQRKAVALLANNIFSKNAFALSPELLDILQDDKLRNWQNSPWVPGKRFDFPYTNWVASLQGATLSQLLGPMRMQRMVDAQYRDPDTYRISELFSTLSDGIWKRNTVATGRTAVMQRNLQRIYIDRLVQMVMNPGSLGAGLPPEAISLARLNLMRIRGDIDRAEKRGGLSDESSAHLMDVHARINRALDAEMESAF